MCAPKNKLKDKDIGRRIKFIDLSVTSEEQKKVEKIFSSLADFLPKNTTYSITIFKNFESIYAEAAVFNEKKHITVRIANSDFLTASNSLLNEVIKKINSINHQISFQNSF